MTPSLLLLTIYNKIGWKQGEPCFYKVKLNKKIERKILSIHLQENISNKLKVFMIWEKKRCCEILMVLNFNIQILKAALILPDGKPRHTNCF